VAPRHDLFTIFVCGTKMGSWRNMGCAHTNCVWKEVFLLKTCGPGICIVETSIQRKLALALPYCICIYTLLHICIYTYVYIYLHVQMYIWANASQCEKTRICFALLYIYICITIYAYIYICAYAFTWKHVYMSQCKRMRGNSHLLCITVYVCIHYSIYVYIHMCIYIYMDACIYEPIQANARKLASALHYSRCVQLSPWVHPGIDIDAYRENSCDAHHLCLLKNLSRPRSRAHTQKTHTHTHTPASVSHI